MSPLKPKLELRAKWETLQVTHLQLPKHEHISEFRRRLCSAFPQWCGARSFFRGDEESCLHWQQEAGVIGQLEEEPVRSEHVAIDGELLAWKSQRSASVPTHQEEFGQVQAFRSVAVRKGNGNYTASLYVDVCNSF